MQETQAHLDHENPDVYRCGIAFLTVAFRLLSSLGRGEGELRDQLERAAMSVLLNIAEGAGKPTVADRAFWVVQQLPEAFPYD